MSAAELLWVERVAGGNFTHQVLGRGSHLQLTDLTGDGCVSILLFAADRPWERLNVADTVKVQWQVYLQEGYCLLSDQGRVLASVVDDTSGHHDMLFGTSTRLLNVERYGDGSLHGASPAGRELLVAAGARYGLGRRDIAGCVNLFQRVLVTDDGSPEFTPRRRPVPG